jgi:hypothetical protein
VLEARGEIGPRLRRARLCSHGVGASFPWPMKTALAFSVPAISTDYPAYGFVPMTPKLGASKRNRRRPKCLT